MGRNIQGFPPKKRKAKLQVTPEDQKIKSTRFDTKDDLYKSKIRIEKREMYKYDAEKTYKEIIKFREGSNQKKISEKNLLSKKYLISNKLGEKNKFKVKFKRNRNYPKKKMILKNFLINI